MKKFVSILTAIIYLVLSTGMVFNAHYCHGELERVSLGPGPSFCCCESKESSASCCKDEQIFVHLDNDEQLQANTKVKFGQLDYVEVEKPVVHDCSSCSEIKEYFYSDLSPPPKLAIWKINCSFLFYG